MRHYLPVRALFLTYIRFYKHAYPKQAKQVRTQDTKKINKSEPDLFFILGSQRSGSTLLRLALNAHPELTVYDELIDYPMLRFHRFPYHPIIGFKIPMWTHKHLFLQKKYPQAKIVFLKRNIKAIVSSMLRLKLTGISWFDLYGNWEIKRSLSGITNLEDKKIFRMLYRKLKKKDEMVLLPTLCAYLKMYLFQEYVQRNRDTYELWYENLVQSPDKTLKALLDYLEVNWHNNVLSHHDFNKHMAIGQTEGSRNIDTTSLNKWISHLSENNIRLVEELTEFLDKELNHPVQT